MTKKLFLTLIISGGTLSLVFAQTSSGDNSKVVVKDEKSQNPDAKTVQYKAITNKKQYYQERGKLNQNEKARKEENKKSPVKNGNTAIKDENDDL